MNLLIELEQRRKYDMTQKNVCRGVTSKGSEINQAGCARGEGERNTQESKKGLYCTHERSKTNGSVGARDITTLQTRLAYFTKTLLVPRSNYILREQFLETRRQAAAGSH